MSKKDVVKYICYATALCSLNVGVNFVSADEVSNVVPTENTSLVINTQTTNTEENVSEAGNQAIAQASNQTSESNAVSSAEAGDTNQIVLASNEQAQTNVQSTDNQEQTDSQLTATENTDSDSEDTTEAPEQVLHTGDYRVDFDNYDDTTMERSDWFNGDPFDCRWVPDNTVVKDGTLTLTIDRNNTRAYSYNAAEWRTREFFGYGMYSVRMQPISNPGVVSSFFTYTGPSDNNPWDEIDIEFLGKDTTKVQFNYYTNGVGGHEYLYNLGFDASQAYHVYGFDWQADHITWYVDGVAVYTATENLPVTPGKIMMNAWPGIGVDDWLAPYDGQTPLVAYYDWISYNGNKVEVENPAIEAYQKAKAAAANLVASTASTTSTISSTQVTTNQAAVEQSVSTASLAKNSFLALPETGQRPSKLLTISGVLVAFLGFLALPFKKGKL